MTGLFNSIGHETEASSSQASAELHDAMAQIHRLMAQTERNDPPNEGQLQEASQQLDRIADDFEQISSQATAYMLFASMDEHGPGGPEMPSMIDELMQLGYQLPLRNDDLPKIAAAEVQRLALVVRNSRLQGRHSDWYSMKEILLQMNRLNEVGIIASRISALHGSDPGLRS